MWPLHRRKQFDILTEFTTHICAYELDYGPDNSKIVLHIHLPSRRVSETYYNSQGKIKQYVQYSPDAEKHIEFLCAQDTKLKHIIQVAESMKENRDYINNRREVCNNILISLIKWCLIPCVILIICYGLYKIFL